MQREPVDLVEIDPEGRLLVHPRNSELELIYRSATGVHWDARLGCLCAPRPEEWTHLEWYQNVSGAVASEYGRLLTIDARTRWRNVPEDLRAEISAWSSSRRPGSRPAPSAPSEDPMRSAVTAANGAFGAGDFARVVDLLSPFEDRLSKADAARLRYARKEIPQSRPTPSVRGPALERFLLGIGGWLLGGLAFYALRASGYEPKGRLAWGILIALALPGSLALVGLLELATGRSFASLARAWDELSGWQRGAIALAVCVVAFAAMIGGVALVFGDWSR